MRYFNAKFAQGATRKDEKGASICYSFGGGTECGSARIPYNFECHQSPEAPDKLSLSWASQAVV